MQPEGARLRWAVQVAAWSPGAAEFELLLSLLPAEEQAGCNKYRQFDDRKRALVSRLLQRRAAVAALGLPHRAVTIRRTKGNKPYVANEQSRPQHAPNWNYNVSHEGDYVILAAEPVCICGCDVAAPKQLRRKQQQPLQEYFRSFQRQLTPAEWAAVQAAGPDDEAQEEQFRKFWSLKEAYVKATGEGLGFELGLAEFSIQGTTAIVNVRGEAQPDWIFHLHQLGRGHWASVARGPPSAVVDAWGDFKATFRRTQYSLVEWQAQLAAAEPPFQLLSIADLVPLEQQTSYEAAGGELV